jgi:hypothetical protein
MCIHVGFWWKCQQERRQGRPRCMWENNNNNNNMDIREVGWGNMDWIRLAWNRDQERALLNTVMNLRVQ